MPIYEYQCKACEHVFDVLQKMSDDLLTYCPECGEPELRKLLSAPNFRLKGGGWYETDFKDKKDSKAESRTDSNAKVDSKPSSGQASKPSGNTSSTE